MLDSHRNIIFYLKKYCDSLHEVYTHILLSKILLKMRSCSCLKEIEYAVFCFEDSSYLIFCSTISQPIKLLDCGPKLVILCNSVTKCSLFHASVGCYIDVLFCTSAVIVIWATSGNWILSLTTIVELERESMPLYFTHVIFVWLMWNCIPCQDWIHYLCYLEYSIECKHEKVNIY